MSVLEKNSIDYIYVEDNHIIMGISDHLTWQEEAIVAHWQLLQDKLKNYIGFIKFKAGELIVGDELLDVNGNVLLVENFDVELTDEPTTVYNFQVENFHTYYVGMNRNWVHNECNLPTKRSKNFVKRVNHRDGSVSITKKNR